MTGSSRTVLSFSPKSTSHGCLFSKTCLLFCCTQAFIFVNDPLAVPAPGNVEPQARIVHWHAARCLSRLLRGAPPAALVAVRPPGSKWLLRYVKLESRGGRLCGALQLVSEIGEKPYLGISQMKVRGVKPGPTLTGGGWLPPPCTIPHRSSPLERKARMSTFGTLATSCPVTAPGQAEWHTASASTTFLQRGCTSTAVPSRSSACRSRG